MFSQKTLIILLAANCLALLAVIWLLLQPQTLPPRLLSDTDGRPHSSDERYALTSREPAPVPSARPAPVLPEANPQPVAAFTPQPQSQPQTGPSDDVSPEIKKFLPLAFVDPDPADKTWDETRLETLARLRKDFSEASRDLTGLDPSSSEYQARWKRVQRDFDNQYRAALGTASYVRYRMEIDQAPEQAGSD
jgi:hypothetical protein